MTPRDIYTILGIIISLITIGLYLRKSVEKIFLLQFANFEKSVEKNQKLTCKKIDRIFGTLECKQDKKECQKDEFIKLKQAFVDHKEIHKNF